MGSKLKKFNSDRFRTLLENRIHSLGYRGVSTFARDKGLSRNSIARSLLGETRPTIETLNKWCRAMGCTPDERAEIISSVYIEEEAIAA